MAGSRFLAHAFGERSGIGKTELRAMARGARDAAIRRKNGIVKEAAPQGDGLRSGRIVGWDHHRRKTERNFDLHYFADRHHGRGRPNLAMKHEPRHQDGDEQNEINFRGIHRPSEEWRLRRSIAIDMQTIVSGVSEPDCSEVCTSKNRSTISGLS